MRIAGTAIEVNGFYFTNGYAPEGAAWELRYGNEVANYCRITNCVIDNYDPASRDTEYSWILLYGRNNRFDHNSIVGKLNSGVTLAVVLDEERNQQNNHLIEYNYFGFRPNLGANGGEIIRVGTSQTSMSSSRTQILANACNRYTPSNNGHNHSQPGSDGIHHFTRYCLSWSISNHEKTGD